MVGRIGEKVFRGFQEGEGEVGVEKAGEGKQSMEKGKRREKNG